MKPILEKARFDIARARLRIILCVLSSGLFIPPAQGEIKLDFWHSYTPPGGVIHFSFQIASYKRGLFFGSCGPSTRSLQWEYDIDLTGPGPVYQNDQITITSEGKKAEVIGGTITVSPNGREATIDLQVKLASDVRAFVANGTHRIKKLK